ncbi:hypothetical protein MKZ38_002227 [Zalerion maritima]|uniref:Uncharacterized protein n=1 Tax=Zalerion maritima TaxID=339359 RepID=A0AAD5RPA3_9PEZI|nr:hypothetical protein MKZ38_002227 [Zalerion maritima]
MDKDADDEVHEPRGSQPYSFPDSIRNVAISNITTLSANPNEDPEEEVNEIPSDDTLILGRYFFTGSVLAIDHDKGEFYLWEANQDPDVDSNLASLGNGCASLADSASRAGQGRSPLTDGSDSSGSSFSGGAIAGAIGIGLAVKRMVECGPAGAKDLPPTPGSRTPINQSDLYSPDELQGREVLGGGALDHTSSQRNARNPANVRTRNHGKNPSMLLDWLYDIVYKPAPYRYVTVKQAAMSRNNPVSVSCPTTPLVDKNKDVKAWFLRIKQKQEVRMEVEEAFEMRGGGRDRPGGHSHERSNESSPIDPSSDANQEVAIRCRPRPSGRSFMRMKDTASPENLGGGVETYTENAGVPERWDA